MNGELPLALGDTGGHGRRGLQRAEPRRADARRAAGRRASRSPSSASTGRSRPRRATTSGCARPRSTSTPPNARGPRGGALDVVRAGGSTIVPPTPGWSGSPAASSSPRARCGRRDGALLFSSPNTNAIYRWTPGRRGDVFRAEERLHRHRHRPLPPAGLERADVRPRGLLTICQHGNRRVLRVNPHGDVDRAGRPLRGPAAEQPQRPRLPLATARSTSPTRRSACRASSTTPTKELPFSGVFRVRDGVSSWRATSSRAPTASRSRPTSGTCTSATGIPTTRSSCATRSPPTARSANGEPSSTT